MLRATILCGLPFSGKTYVVGRIRESTNAIVVSFDDIKDEIFPLKMMMEEQDWQLVKRVALERYETALAAKKNVIWDSSNPLKTHRLELAELAKRYGAQETIVFEYTTRGDLLQKRAEYRNPSSTPGRRKRILQNIRNLGRAK